MTRKSRVFKLRLSPLGKDLLVDAHCHLIRSTRALLAWGTTLQVAVGHLDAFPVDRLIAEFDASFCAACLGPEEHHLGGPKGLNDVAAGIAARVEDASGGAVRIGISVIYIFAIQQLLRAEPELLRTALQGLRSARPAKD
ncbi:hypothetical protein [Sphingomonas sp. OTU376]|uniref:hypothetical protein n=1 Tax=Sphingomonas sp. OTU376 TaxID=3043863 RepID=UPI00313E65FB